MAIDPGTRVGAVRLNVADLDRQQAFSERVLGLRTIAREEEAIARLGADGTAFLELAGRPGAPLRPPRTSGLFHFAVLVPDRPALAASLRRIADAGWRLSGASDHLVSEALYLSDPEGNGIEIYRDRPREEWPREGGEIQMATMPLDLGSLLEEPETADGGVPAGTRIGHVHLQVGDLDAEEAFWQGDVGLDVTVRSYPGALFMSAGGYHHHVGLNTWAGEGVPAPPPGALGLDYFELVVPGREGDPQRLTGPSGAGVVLRPPGP